MQNRPAILSYLVLGVLFISLAVYLTWKYGNIQTYTITSVACIIAGGVCFVVSGMSFLRSRDKEDFFHLE